MIDQTNETWRDIQEFATKRIADLIEKLQAEPAEREASRICGQIRAFKEVISLPEHQRKEFSMRTDSILPNEYRS